jgi:hypothetical protein
LKRLVIKKGDQILRHEVGTESVTFGRDPSCSYSFDDPALSRRHATFEPTSKGLRFIDLGSRNGSWVNTRKTTEAELQHGDTIRIGSLVITYASEEEPPPPPLPPPEDDPGDATATVIVSKVSKAKAPTPAMPPPSQKADKTLLLDRREKAAPSPAGGTLLLSRDEPKAPGSDIRPDTARLPESVLRPAPPPLPEAPRAERPPEPPARRADSMSWTAKHALVTFGVGLVLYLVVAFPLVRTLGNALREESLRRGRVLLDLLATTNAVSVGEGRARDLDVSAITREERVKEALLLDLRGKVLAPSARVGESLTTLSGIQSPIEEIRTFYLGRRPNGDYVFVEPILYRGQRVGIAVLVYEAASTSGSLAVAVLFLGFLVLLLGVAVALLLGKRFTLAPVFELRDDVEAVVKGDASEVPLSQGFSELSEVARSINRLIERAPAPALPRPLQPEPPHARRQPPAAAPAPSPAISPPLPAASGAVSRFWTDSNFLVIAAEPEAAAILGSSAESLAGHHVIEAVKDQKLLGVVLDALNSLDTAAGTEVVAELDRGPVSVSAVREGERVVVSLKPTA